MVKHEPTSQPSLGLPCLASAQHFLFRRSLIIIGSVVYMISVSDAPLADQIHCRHTAGQSMPATFHSSLNVIWPIVDPNLKCFRAGMQSWLSVYFEFLPGKEGSFEFPFHGYEDTIIPGFWEIGLRSVVTHPEVELRLFMSLDGVNKAK